MSPAPRTRSRRSGARGARLVAGVVAASLCAACAEPARPPRTSFVAAWVDPHAAVPNARDLERLAAAGARELFLEAASLSWQSGAPRVDVAEIPMLARATPTTLVVGGIWARPNESAKSTARAWRAALEPVWHELGRRSFTPVGVHFELEANAARAELAEVLARLRRELPTTILLSVSLDPRALALEGTAELARSVDFVVATVWGQPPGEPEDGARWDLERTTAPALAAVGALGVPHAAGGWTLGTSYRRAADGTIADEDPSLGLEAVQRATGARHLGESLLQGIDRQVNEWAFASPALVGSWRLAPGESVRVVRPATVDLEAFLARCERAGGRRVGVILRRFAGPREPLALSAENLVAALEPGEAEPRLAVAFEALPSRASRPRFRVTLQNLNDEPTDLGGLESNFVELRFDGAVAARVDAGDFDSWEPLWEGQERRTLRALREADTLRLHATRVGGHQRLESGPIELSARRGARRLTARGSFFLPGGRVLELAETSWDFATAE